MRAPYMAMFWVATAVLSFRRLWFSVEIEASLGVGLIISLLYSGMFSFAAAQAAKQLRLWLKD